MSSLGRNGLIGLGIGVTVSTGLVAFLIIKEMVRRRRERCLAVSRSSAGFAVSSAAVDGGITLGQDGGVVLASALSGLTPEQHTELRKTLDDVMMSVSSLRGEVAELRNGLRDIASTIVEDVRYTTAYSTAESDYTDRETDRDEDRDEDDEDDDDEEEERSCATVLTLQPDELQSEEDYVDGDEEAMTMMNPELTLMLTQSDFLHAGDSGKKTDGFNLLTENKPLYSDNVEFLWRLARAYNDMCEHAEDEDERRSYVEQGRDEAESALQRNGLNADCHKWFAVLTAQTSQCDSMHSKLKCSHILKEHLDRALALRDDDPLCFYLLGRWCYEMSRLSWLEQKAAAALYETPPCSSLQHALENFLKAEELKPGFSRAVRLYIAKCHKDLGNESEARNWTHLALATPTNTHQEAGISGLEAELKALIDSPAEQL
ncbi:regulator of microtubule dynamics protein 3 isoform X2 [Pangasianodon hypophthalmus]|uniref:regulator of microtubule dynamics protein 3 isoform X2 n=1 Tax=Pangasianodon hypophthalmus TaxID=310915 RepID=UPI0023070C14|nr:regulator of microtubule dynamics protein 3 isoform X2 [Pangasianodon hypophthalmus]